MRKLVIVAVMLSVLGLTSTWVVSGHTVRQPTFLQLAGDVGPGGG